MITIRPYQETDFEHWVKLTHLLFPKESIEEIREAHHKTWAKGRTNVFFACIDERVVGFAEGSIRYDYVEGASSSPTGYLEAIYVEEEYRRTGAAKLLVRAVESWCAQNGCTEIGSDTWLWNTDAQAFHEKVGFIEEDRLVHYIKPLE